MFIIIAKNLTVYVCVSAVIEGFSDGTQNVPSISAYCGGGEKNNYL